MKKQQRAAVFSSDSRTMVSASSDGWIPYWRVGELEEDFSFNVGEDVSALAVPPNDKLLATGNAAGGVRLWDFHSGKSLGSMSGHLRKVTNLKFSRDGRLVASSAANREVRLWDVDTR